MARAGPPTGLDGTKVKRQSGAPELDPAGQNDGMSAFRPPDPPPGSLFGADQRLIVLPIAAGREI